MIGAIIGDIVGSRFEFNNYRHKDFDFFSDECSLTDDSIMTLSIAKAILNCNGDYKNLDKECIKEMTSIGRCYPYCGFGGHFYRWIFEDNPKPYNSFGNGSAMRVSAVAYVSNSIKEVKELSKKVTEISHNHPEGIKGAEATAVATYLALHGSNMDEIKEYIEKNYYPMDFMIDDIREDYEFNEICQETVPQAIKCFLESTSFEDAIRIAISLGGDSDTIGAITGAIAEAYYGVPINIRNIALSYFDERLLKILMDFEDKYPPKISK